ncbi:ral GEF with PH domain and SH3 binding motif [Arctopsyche grandis]|uniref:ral GEF with PH domain and SH3 binding motif n=1 Tax=Arctopsyche grandis TaxID=121162 RepID=UPI00406D8224
MMMTELDTCKFAEIKEDDDFNIYATAFNGIENCAYSIGKTNSLPANAKMESWDDDSIQFAVQVSPEVLASQITLLDFPVFCSIQPEELSSCAWTKKNKSIIAPNVVNFTKRFNQVSFWTVEEILTGSTAKRRSEILSHFIKVAQKLLEMKNIHSLFAVVSGLHSASIYRLTSTWAHVPKKERQILDRLQELFSTTNNWCNLRDFISNAELPCIPYIGVFLTDLVYLDMANSELEPPNPKMDAILTCITYFKKSNYFVLKPELAVQDYLRSLRYIEELQKFHEDDQYKISLKLEPPSNANSPSSSKDSVEKPGRSSGVSPSHRSITGSFKISAISLQAKLMGHRRCQSLGNSIINKGGESSDSVGDPNRILTSGINLLDDTICDQSICSSQMFNSTINSIGDMAGAGHWGNGFKGFLKRKTILKNNRKPSISAWQRYWVEIFRNSLVYFSPKRFHGVFSHTRNSFKEQPTKIQSLDDWELIFKEESDTFLLKNSKLGQAYKFQAQTVEEAIQWLAVLKTATFQCQKSLPANLMSFE